MGQLLAVVAVAAVFFVSLQSGNAQKPAGNTGNVTDLGALGGSFSAAFGINNISSDPASIQVVGRSTTPAGFAHAFVWTAPGPMIDLGTLGGNSGSAMGINNHGQIAGQSDDASGDDYAVVWTNPGSGWVIENLGTLTGACCAGAQGINNGTAGDPATVAVAGFSNGRAVVWTKAGAGWTIQDLGTWPGDTFSFARDINDVGDVVGSSFNNVTQVFRPVLWHAATATMLELPGLGGETSGLRINDAGDVAGASYDVSGNEHAVRWRSATNWTVEDLGTLGGCCSEGYGINNFGDIVGVSNTSGRRRSNGSQHPFLFLAGAAAMTDLGGTRGTAAARDVNDFGYAVGDGDAGRSHHALLWRLSPVAANHDSDGGSNGTLITVRRR